MIEVGLFATSDALDGGVFAAALGAGLSRMVEKRAYLNKINFFPVPDGDTGTNMAATAEGILAVINGQAVPRHLGQFLQSVAAAALISGQGNSGALLAQLFSSLATTLANHSQASLAEYAKALHGAAVAVPAVVDRPREGTFITVLRDHAQAMNQWAEQWPGAKDASQQIWIGARQALHQSLERTKNTVNGSFVDAGALGLAYLLEGMMEYFASEKDDGRLIKIDKNDSLLITDDPSLLRNNIGASGAELHVLSAQNIENLRHEYCCECTIEVAGGGNDLERLKDRLHKLASTLGESFILAGGPSLFKVHLHAQSPSQVFQTFRAFGTVRQEKADSMIQQWRDAHKPPGHDDRVAIVVDSSCDLPASLFKKYNIHLIPARVSFGQDHYADKVSILPAEFYEKVKRLKKSDPYPTTASCTAKDFLRTYQFLAQHYQNVLSIHFPRKHSGIYHAAKTFAQQTSEQIHVVDTPAFGIGLGLLVQSAARDVERGLSLDEIKDRLAARAQRLHFYIGFNTVKYLVRGGRLSARRGFVAQLLGIKPLLSFDSESNIALVGQAFRRRSQIRALAGKIAECAAKYSHVEVMIAHGNCLHDALELQSQLVEKLGLPPAGIAIAEFSPTLGVHGGPLMIGAALLGEDADAGQTPSRLRD